MTLPIPIYIVSIGKDRSQTDTTADEPCKGFRTQANDGALAYSDTESLDDTVIRNKIAEANRLIDRVKKALDKMKSGQTSKQPVDLQSDVNHSSTTDIEVTIDRLRMETERLMTGHKEELETKRACKRNIRESMEKKSDHCPGSFKRREIRKEDEPPSSCDSLNKTFVKEHIPIEELAQEPVPQSTPCCSRDLKVRTKSSEQIEENSRNIDKFDLDRPMTRRNETEDDLPEERLLDKFRSCPQEGQSIVDSSLEELQAKLQTISESTESSLSTPRNRKYCDPPGIIIAPKEKEVQPCGCNTDSVKCETRAVQAESEKSNVGITCAALCEHKISQIVSKRAVLTPCHMDVQTFASQLIPLVATHLKPHEILPKQESCQKCKVEKLPSVELAPFQETDMGNNSEKKLIEEHLPGVNILSQRDKRQKLTIQVLPSISIDMMSTELVLNLYISPNGETVNFLRETENVTLFLTKSNPRVTAATTNSIQDGWDTTYNNVSFFGHVKKIEQDKWTKPLPPVPQPDGWSFISSNRPSSSAGRPDLASTHTSLNASSSGRIEVGRNPEFFRKLREDAVRNIGDVETVDAAKSHKHDTLNEEMKKKAIVYQSYNLVDNRNRHDPGNLDAKSVERIAGIDTNVYKTFINPKGVPAPSDDPSCFWPRRERSEGVVSTATATTVECNLDLLSEDKRSQAPSIISSRDLHFATASTASLENSKRKHRGKSDEAGPYKVTVVAQPEFESVYIISDHRDESDESKSSIENSVKLELEARLQSAQRTPQLSQQMSDVLQLGLSEPRVAQALKPHESKSTPSSAASAQYASPPPPVQWKLDVAEAMPRPPIEQDYFSTRPPIEQDYFSTPSEITVTISYTLSSEGSTNSRDNPSVSANSEGPATDVEQKVITVKDKDIIYKLQEKLHTVSVDSSDPKLIIKNAMSEETTNYIKGLIRMSKATDPDDNSPQTSEEVLNVHNVNYHMIDGCLDSNVILYPEHLTVAKNGRYKDEENLFAQSPYPKPTSFQQKVVPPTPSANKTEDKEVQNDILGLYPRQMVNRYSPESTTSNTVTSNSLSDGEIPCRHTVSNGEIHVCPQRNRMNRPSRVILPRSNLTRFSMNPSHNTAPTQRQILARSHLTNASLNPVHTPTQRNVLTRNIARLSTSPNRSTSPRKFDLLDPKLTVEKRRNYFNNWVTYYVKSQDVLDSSTSSCSHNNK